MRTLLLHETWKNYFSWTQALIKDLESPDALSIHIHGINLAKRTNLVHFISLWLFDSGEDKFFKENFMGQMSWIHT